MSQAGSTLSCRERARRFYQSWPVLFLGQPVSSLSCRGTTDPHPLHWAVDFIRLEPSRFLGLASSILLLQADSITWFDLSWLAIADLFSLTCRIEQGNSRGELMPSSNSKAAHMMPNLYLTLFGWIPSWLCEEWCDRPTNLRTGRYSYLPACSFFFKKLICIILLGTKQEANIKSNSYLLELPKAKKTTRPLGKQTWQKTWKKPMPNVKFQSSIAGIRLYNHRDLMDHQPSPIGWSTRQHGPIQICTRKKTWVHYLIHLRPSDPISKAQIPKWRIVVQAPN